MQYLLSGGQACILYGASEFSRDADIVVLASAANLDALRSALRELDAEQVFVPALDADFLNRGHACHFRCRHPEAAAFRLDVMSVLRGCDPFQMLWARRTTIELPELGEVPLLSLPDLVQSKKTQRDKDWSHIRRLVEVDYLTRGARCRQRAPEARDEDVLWWLAELRTPAYLIGLARARPDLLPRVPSRPWLAEPSRCGEEAIEAELLAEEQRARAQDRAYWEPLRRELEELRQKQRPGLMRRPTGTSVPDHHIESQLDEGKAALLHGQREARERTPTTEEHAVATGRVFNIQRFSIHDGPGIRTTVFLKGCTLGCVWCHNPESISRQPELAFFPSKCIACRQCFAACENDALTLVADKRQYDVGRCRLCGRCVAVCYAEALVMEGRDATAEEVVVEVLKDKPFYDNSGGGVTLSGGEPLLQADFAAEILARCREQGVHTCLDTAAHVAWGAFEKVLPHTDLVLLDLKLMDPERHLKTTGARNDLILANARRLGTMAVPLIVRVPVIPCLTDDEANIGAIADFLRPFPNLEYVELLPYHRFAEAKYRRLGRSYELEGTEPPPQERLAALADIVARRGIQTKAGQATSRPAAQQGSEPVERETRRR